MDGDSSGSGHSPSDETSQKSANMSATHMRSSMKKEPRGSMGSYRDMSYREKPATPNSPSGTTVTTMYDHLLSPPSPHENQEEEKDDRLRNDLLDEICNDMGIDDSMDLDLDDFCYNGQKAGGSGANMQQRFGQIVTPGKQAEADQRRGSVTTTASSGYATSDSLCAIAKLTQSISNDGSQGQPGSSDAAVEGRQRDSPESVKVKHESEAESCEQSGVNDTDQGKAAAASKLALQKQLSESAATPDRKRSATSEPASAAETSNQRLSAPPVIDYSYQDDYSMEDMTEPDTMINFSAMPQQPNYYQPQAAHDNLNLGFNLSLQQQHAASQHGYGLPSAHQQPSQPFGQMGFGGMPQHHTNDISMGRSSPQLRAAHSSFHNSTVHWSGQSASFSQTTSTSPGKAKKGAASVVAQTRASTQTNYFVNPINEMGPAQMHQQQHGGSPFQSSCQQPSTASGPSSLQSNPSTPNQGFQRSESFPGAPGPFHGGSAVGQSPAHQQPGTAPPQHNQSVPHQSLPDTPTQKSASQAVTSSTASAAGSSAAASSAASNFNNSQQGFMQRLVTDKSSAFRSHPLFPLLRDLIIADMNFHEPSFPHSLIRDLPSDFNKLLTNYLSRNPRKRNYQSNQSVESVVMDALKYAHHTLIEKISQKKLLQQQQQQEEATAGSTRNNNMSTAVPNNSQPPMTHMPMSNINEYCVKFEETVRQSIPQAGYGNRGTMSQQASPVGAFRPARIREPGSMYGGEIGSGGTYNQPLTVDTGCPSPSSTRTSNPLTTAPPSTQPTPIYGGQSGAPPPQYHHGIPGGYPRTPQQPNPRNPYMNPHGPPCPPPNYTVSPNNPPLPRHQQSMYDMGPPPSAGPHGMYGDLNSSYTDPYCMPPPAAHHHRLAHMGPPDRHLMYMNNINDPNLVKQMMDGTKLEMYDSDTASVMSGHSMQGSVKGSPHGQGKPTEGRKHASLPKEAVNIMLNWLREHQDKPYPNDDEKGMLIKQTGLSITQINYWFTNARRRLLPKWRGEDM